MQRQILSRSTKMHDENYYLDLFTKRFYDTKRKKGTAELIPHSIRVAKSAHEMTRSLPLAIEGLMHTFDIREVMEKCPEMAGLINPYQFKAYKLLKEWELRADFTNPANLAPFLNILHRFPLAVALRVLDLEETSHNEPMERMKTYQRIGIEPEIVVNKIMEAIESVYIPFARRIGWQKTRWALRDMSLCTQYPKLREETFSWYKKQEQKLEELKVFLEGILPNSTAVIETRVRMKTPESVLRKLVRKAEESEESELVKKYSSYESKLEVLPDLVAAQCILRNDEREKIYYTKSLLIPRLKSHGFEIVKTSDGEEFEIRKYGTLEQIHVIAKVPRRFGSFKIEIQIMTQEVDAELKDGEFSHERYKGGKLDTATMKKIERIGFAIGRWRPDPCDQLQLIQVSSVDLDGASEFQTIAFPHRITMLDLLAAVGRVELNELHIKTQGYREAELFVNPNNYGYMLNPDNTTYEIFGSGKSIHETTSSKELRFLRKILKNVWAETLAGYLQKMMMTED